MQTLLHQQDTDALQGAQAAGSNEEEEGDSVAWQRVGQLLGCKCDRIDPVQALALLPLQVNTRAVATMPPYLRHAFQPCPTFNAGQPFAASVSHCPTRNAEGFKRAKHIAGNPPAGVDYLLSA